MIRLTDVHEIEKALTPWDKDFEFTLTSMKTGLIIGYLTRRLWQSGRSHWKKPEWLVYQQDEHLGPIKFLGHLHQRPLNFYMTDSASVHLTEARTPESPEVLAFRFLLKALAKGKLPETLVVEQRDRPNKDTAQVL